MTERLRSALAAALGVCLVALVLVVSGCSDDPILGPGDGSDDGGGSYGVINRLAPDDSTAANPAQF